MEKFFGLPNLAAQAALGPGSNKKRVMMVVKLGRASKPSFLIAQNVSAGIVSNPLTKRLPTLLALRLGTEPSSAGNPPDR